MKIDDVNQKLIRYLRDGRRSFSEIAKKMLITPNTVRGRVRKLISNDVLEITGVIDAGKITDHFLAFVGIKLQNVNVLKKAEHFSKLKGVVSVAIVTGQFDLILTVLLNTDFGLLEFITKEVRKLGPVLSTETFVVFKSYKLKVPYVL